MMIEVQAPPPSPSAPAAPLSAIIDSEIEMEYEGLGGNYPLHINMIAGSLAGITEHAVMFPVDLVRVRIRII